MDTGDFILIKRKPSYLIPVSSTKRKPNEKVTCEVCGKRYTGWNKHKHVHSQYHQLAVKLTNKNNLN